MYLKLSNIYSSFIALDTILSKKNITIISQKTSLSSLLVLMWCKINQIKLQLHF